MTAVSKTQFPFSRDDFVDAVKVNRVIITEHANRKLAQRGISTAITKEALLRGEWREPDSLAKPPKICIHYRTGGKELKIVASYKEQSKYVFVITVYFLGME